MLFYQVNLAKFVIPGLLIGVYALWMYDKSHREVCIEPSSAHPVDDIPGHDLETPVQVQVNVANKELLYSISKDQKPFKHFQQMQHPTQGTTNVGSTDDAGRKVAAGARAVFSALEMQVWALHALLRHSTHFRCPSQQPAGILGTPTTPSVAFAQANANPQNEGAVGGEAATEGDTAG